MAKTTVIFDQGMNEGGDKRLLKTGQPRAIVNGRISRDGQIRIRPGYTAIAVPSYGTGNVVAYDLATYDDRLIALGDRLARGYPTDLFEYVPNGGAASWKPSDYQTSYPRLPRATAVRDILKTPNQQGGVHTMGCAAAGGLVCITWNDNVVETGYARVARAVDDQTIVDLRLANGYRKKLRPVALTSRIIVIGIDSDDDAMGSRYLDAADDEYFLAGVNDILTAGANDFVVYDVARVAGADEFVIAAVMNNGEVIFRHYDEDGSVQTPSGGQFSNISLSGSGTAIAVEADSASDTLTVAVVDDGTVKLYSYTISTGAQIGSPPFTPSENSGETAVEVGICRIDATTLKVVFTLSTVGTPDNPSVYQSTYTVSSGNLATADVTAGCRLSSTPVMHDGETFFGARTDEWVQSPNLVLSRGESTSLPGLMTPEIRKELGFADSTSSLLPQLTRDETTGKYYWCNGVKNSDDTTTAQVTEFELGSTARRQMAQMAGLLYVAGGMPCVYDGALLSELGFVERPEIISLTGSNGSGELVSGATYTYRLVWKWVDTDRNVVRSAISPNLQVTLGASDDTVTAVCTTPHTLRTNEGSKVHGSSVQLELYRNRVTVETTAPSLTGSEILEPPSASLDGLTLGIFYSVGDTYNLYTVTFDSGSTGIDEIVDDVNAVTSGSVTASSSAGRLKLTGDDQGDGVIIYITGSSTALGILGLSAGQFSEGTTVTTPDAVFRLTATGATVVDTGKGGDHVSITDVRDDDSDEDGIASQAVIYDQLITPLQDHAPNPFEVMAVGGERMATAKGPLRDLVAFAKLLNPSEPVTFPASGLAAFEKRVGSEIEAVSFTGNVWTAWTRRAIWQIRGDGPQRNAQGEFFAVHRVPSQGGMKKDGWRSLVQTDEGDFFQLDDDKIYVMAPGGAPQWVGQAVRDTLESFPVITAAVHVRGAQIVAFAANDDAIDDATDGRILIYDQRKKAWTVDDVGGPVAALGDYEGRLAYVDGSGVVHLEDTAAGSGTFVPLTIELGDFTGWPPMGNGDFISAGVLGEIRGDCSLELQISTNHRTWTSCGGAVSISGTAGDPLEHLFKPPRGLQSVNRFALRLLVTGTSDSAGVYLNAIDIEHRHEGDAPVLAGRSHSG